MIDITYLSKVPITIINKLPRKVLLSTHFLCHSNLHTLIYYIFIQVLVWGLAKIRARLIHLPDPTAVGFSSDTHLCLLNAYIIHSTMLVNQLTMLNV